MVASSVRTTLPWSAIEVAPVAGEESGRFSQMARMVLESVIGSNGLGITSIAPARFKAAISLGRAFAVMNTAGTPTPSGRARSRCSVSGPSSSGIITSRQDQIGSEFRNDRHGLLAVRA